MSKRRALGLVVVAALVAVILAACGAGTSTSRNASSTSSTLDPATKVPTSAVVYASVTVKPSASLQADLEQTVDELAGPGAADKLVNDFKKSLGDPAIVKSVQSWLGPQVAIAITQLPSGNITKSTLEQHLVIVLPTTDPAQTRRFLAAQPKSTLAAAGGIATTWKVSGHFGLIGGADAVKAADATSAGQSLASDADFNSAVAQIGGDQLVTAFVRPAPVLQAVLPLLSRSLTTTQMNTLTKSVPANSTVTLGVSAGPKTLSFDAVTQGLPKGKSTGSPSDVGQLPGDSWLALAAAGALADPKVIAAVNAQAPAVISQGELKAGALGTSAQGFLPFVESDLLPALGPISVSAAGTSLSSLRLGVEIAPDNPAAGLKLVLALKRMLVALPVSVSYVEKKVVVTFGYSSPMDFLTPSSHLSGNSTYKAAVAQMPTGSEIPLYLDFGPIATLGAMFDKSQGDTSVWSIVKRLNYLIAGGTSTHFRVVLAVN